VARIHTAARSVGLARGALEDSIACASARSSSGGRSAISAIRFKIA
jgi:alkylation response protein AidB-like acyl-CoA dehydrogenase